MKIAVLSDVHDRLDHLARVLESVRTQGCERLFFLGDFCSPFTVASLGEGFSGPIDCVFGNNDADLFLFHKVALRFPQLTFHAPLAELEIEGRKILLHHFPEIARRLAKSGEADAVFSGHDHQRYIHYFGSCLWANPGEIMGRFGVVSWGLYDTTAHEFSHIEV